MRPGACEVFRDDGPVVIFEYAESWRLTTTNKGKQISARPARPGRLGTGTDGICVPVTACTCCPARLVPLARLRKGLPITTGSNRSSHIIGEKSVNIAVQVAVLSARRNFLIRGLIVGPERCCAWIAVLLQSVIMLLTDHPG